jgi:hypothetical protein
VRLDNEDDKNFLLQPICGDHRAFLAMNRNARNHYRSLKNPEEQERFAVGFLVSRTPASGNRKKGGGYGRYNSGGATGGGEQDNRGAAGQGQAPDEYHEVVDGVLRKFDEAIHENGLRVRDFFSSVDLSNDGSLDTAELRAGLLSVGLSLTDHEASIVVAGLDKNGDGKISIDEVQAAVMDFRRECTLPAVDTEEMRRYRELDKERHPNKYKNYLKKNNPDGDLTVKKDGEGLDARERSAEEQAAMEVDVSTMAPEEFEKKYGIREEVWRLEAAQGGGKKGEAGKGENGEEGGLNFDGLFGVESAGESAGDQSASPGDQSASPASALRALGTLGERVAAINAERVLERLLRHVFAVRTARAEADEGDGTTTVDALLEMLGLKNRAEPTGAEAKAEEERKAKKEVGWGKLRDIVVGDVNAVNALKDPMRQNHDWGTILLDPLYQFKPVLPLRSWEDSHCMPLELTPMQLHQSLRQWSWKKTGEDGEQLEGEEEDEVDPVTLDEACALVLDIDTDGDGCVSRAELQNAINFALGRMHLQMNALSQLKHTARIHDHSRLQMALEKEARQQRFEERERKREAAKRQRDLRVAKDWEQHLRQKEACQGQPLGKVWRHVGDDRMGWKKGARWDEIGQQPSPVSLHRLKSKSTPADMRAVGGGSSLESKARHRLANSSILSPKAAVGVGAGVGSTSRDRDVDRSILLRRKANTYDENTLMLRGRRGWRTEGLSRGGGEVCVTRVEDEQARAVRVAQAQQQIEVVEATREAVVGLFGVDECTRREAGATQQPEYKYTGNPRGYTFGSWSCADSSDATHYIDRPGGRRSPTERARPVLKMSSPLDQENYLTDKVDRLKQTIVRGGGSFGGSSRPGSAFSRSSGSRPCSAFSRSSSGSRPVSGKRVVIAETMNTTTEYATMGISSPIKHSHSSRMHTQPILYDDAKDVPLGEWLDGHEEPHDLEYAAWEAEEIRCADTSVGAADVAGLLDVRSGSNVLGVGVVGGRGMPGMAVTPDSTGSSPSSPSSPSHSRPTSAHHNPLHPTTLRTSFAGSSTAGDWSRPTSAASQSSAMSLSMGTMGMSTSMGSSMGSAYGGGMNMTAEGNYGVGGFSGMYSRPNSGSTSSRPNSAVRARMPLTLQPTHGLSVRVPGAGAEVRPVTVLPSIGALSHDGVGEIWQSPVIVPKRVGDPRGLQLGMTQPSFNKKVKACVCVCIMCSACVERTQVRGYNVQCMRVR